MRAKRARKIFYREGLRKASYNNMEMRAERAQKFRLERKKIYNTLNYFAVY